MLWKIVAGLIAGCFAGALVVAFLPRIQPSAASQKAAVEQPVFVAQPVVVPAAQKAAAVAHPIAKEAINKLASALRRSMQSEPIVSLSIPIDDARRLCAEGLVAFAKGDIATARAFLKRAAEGGDARALMALGDTYDPTTLARLGAVGLKGDEAAARAYYSRALAAGVGGARERIAALAAK
jgi:predicted lipid-binding transport protein (Tim44 family)